MKSLGIMRRKKKNNNKQTTCKTGLEPDETIQIEGGFGKVRVCKWQVNEGAILTLKCCFEYDNIYKAGGAFQLLSRTAFKMRLHVRPGRSKRWQFWGCTREKYRRKEGGGQDTVTNIKMRVGHVAGYSLALTKAKQLREITQRCIQTHACIMTTRRGNKPGRMSSPDLFSFKAFCYIIRV